MYGREPFHYFFLMFTSVWRVTQELTVTDSSTGHFHGVPSGQFARAVQARFLASVMKAYCFGAILRGDGETPCFWIDDRLVK